ncbi:MAG: phage-shock protein [Lawsonibacter sp.]
MIPLLTLSLICFISIPVLMLAMVLFAIPFAIILALLPWFLRLAAVILLIRALMERPFTLNSLVPAALIFGLSVLLR